jgi:hypothetical protein
MKVLHLYEVKMLDGTRYRGEIAYKDEQKVVLKMRNHVPQQKVRIYNNGIQSIRDVGWQKAYALR